MGLHRTRQSHRPLPKQDPVSCLKFLGAELNTVAGYSQMPVDLLSALVLRLGGCLGAKKLTLQELQLLVGHFNFACRM